MSTANPETVAGQCLCGTVRLEIDFPAFWAWHDHAPNSRLAHGAAYATYVGTWRKRLRITAGAGAIRRYTEPATASIRSFCGICGTPVLYERGLAPRMVDVPRALFPSGIGRQPLYHRSIEERRDWAYTDAPLMPLKGYPGVVWERPQRRKRPRQRGELVPD